MRYGVDDTRGMAWVAVQDSGIGIDEEAQTRIFEKFYRAPAARVMEQQGLGLGLTLVQRLVDAHNGRVELQSALNEGSTFTVFLPLARPELEGARPAAPQTLFEGETNG